MKVKAAPKGKKGTGTCTSSDKTSRLEIPAWDKRIWLVAPAASLALTVIFYTLFSSVPAKNYRWRIAKIREHR